MLVGAHCGNHTKYEIVVNCGQKAVLSCEDGCAHSCNVLLSCTELVTYIWFLLVFGTVSCYARRLTPTLRALNHVCAEGLSEGILK